MGYYTILMLFVAILYIFLARMLDQQTIKATIETIVKNSQNAHENRIAETFESTELRSFEGEIRQILVMTVQGNNKKVVQVMNYKAVEFAYLQAMQFSIYWKELGDNARTIQELEVKLVKKHTISGEDHRTDEFKGKKIVFSNITKYFFLKKIYF